MRIAVAQITSGADKSENLELVREYSQRAADQGAQLVVFPEATMQGFGTGRLDHNAEPLDGPFVQALESIADSSSITILAGVFSPADQVERDGKAFNRIDNVAVVRGKAQANYKKIHTYDAFGYRESDTVRPGEALCTFELFDVTFGIAICFDIRYPEQFRELARAGAQVILVPASWNDGEDKQRQWELLSAARALDSTSFVVACGQARPEDERPSEAPTGIGYSRVLDPTGQVIASAGATPELLVVDIDPEVVAKVRKTLPVL
ncbi:carbon-nitrogen hydrolase family protein [Corynebacterium gerontici]|uniref:2-oxoglutaramate amidase n=1 Tax=Corynebacterium gerontici TaxID=2079234 RepID=A0A3G6IY54_9CORY|nr:carbon-nitrogen hydrolase family protein [Corynebacterium gerontici]AZA10586.1 2-oxoglutaramate amidase [Corynebacterium gerontici]